MKRRKYSQEEEKKIQQVVKEVSSIREAAKILGMSQTALNSPYQRRPWDYPPHSIPFNLIEAKNCEIKDYIVRKSPKRWESLLLLLGDILKIKVFQQKG